jgi:hypothetical protein
MRRIGRDQRAQEIASGPFVVARRARARTSDVRRMTSVRVRRPGAKRIRSPTHNRKRPPQWTVSRILFAFAHGLAAGSVGVTIIPLAPPLLAGSSDLPGSFGRAVLLCFPIWSCSVRGFACHPCCHGRGALLPHLFTLTLLRSRSLAAAGELRGASLAARPDEAR